MDSKGDQSSKCHALRMNRDFCPYFVRCDPPQACSGDNTCSEGYEYLKDKCEASESLVVNCTSDNDCSNGASCGPDSPEACSSCLEGKCVCNLGQKRCSLCTVEKYFREGGSCVECPQNVLLLIIMFAGGAICACIVGYVLNRKSVNLGEHIIHGRYADYDCVAQRSCRSELIMCRCLLCFGSRMCRGLQSW